MGTAIHLHTHILPGKRIEVSSPALPESGLVELVIYLPDSAEENAAEAEQSIPAAERYPEAVNVEYDVLVQAQRQRALTEEEATRLEEIRGRIDALDTASGADAEWKRRIVQIREQLAEIRREAERLPDAP